MAVGPQRLVEEENNDVMISPPVPPDGGWGWLVVFASLMCNIIVDGIVFSFGVFYSELTSADFAEESSSKVSLIGSLLVGCYLLAGPLTSALANRFGCRKVTISGSIISATAFFISSFVTNLNMLIFLYGIIGGIGFGMIYLPAIVIVGYYFERRRAMATGIAVCGSGIGTLAFPPLIQFLLDKYQWQGTNWILAGITLNCAVCGALFRPLAGPKPFKLKPKKRIRADQIIVERGNIMQKLIEEKARQKALSTHSLDNVMITNDNSIVKDPKLVNLLDYQKNFQKLPEKGLLPKVKSMVLSKSTGNIEGSKVNVSTLPAITVEDVDSGTESGMSSPDALSGGIIGSTRSLHPQFLINKHLKRAKDAELGFTNSGFVTPPRRAPRKRADTISSAYASEEDLSQFGSKVNNLDKKQQEEYRKDLARPMYRKDIFYTGSANHFSKCKSVLSLDTAWTHNTDMTMITIPDRSEYGDESAGCYIPKAMKDVLKAMLDLHLLKSPTFLLLSLSSTLSMSGFFVPFVYIKANAMKIGVSPYWATFLISVLGMTNIVGRITTGFLSDIKWMDCLLINNFALVVAGGATMLAPFCDNYTGLVVYCAVFGVCIAAFVSLRSIIIVELLGLERLTNAFGLLILFQGIASVGGSPMAASLYEMSGSYDKSFYTAGAMIAFSGILCFPLRKIAEKEFSKERMFNKNLYYSADRIASYYYNAAKHLPPEGSPVEEGAAAAANYVMPDTPEGRRSEFDCGSEVIELSDPCINDIETVM